jgi:hypothetical protein
LGTGPDLAVETLSVGVHTITLRADDGQGGVATDTVTVTVVDSPALLPAPASKLLAGPASLLLAPAQGQLTAVVAVDNADLASVIRWNAKASAPWITLNEASGETPADVTVGLAAGLPPGTYNGTITFTSPDLPGQSVQIAVAARVSDVHTVLLPLLLK